MSTTIIPECKYCLEPIILKEHIIYPCQCKTPVCLLCLCEHIYHSSNEYCEICTVHYEFTENVLNEINDFALVKSFEEYTKNKKSIENDVVENDNTICSVKILYAIAFIFLLMLASVVIAYLITR